MSNPRSEPRQRDLEDVLRRALHTAADSVEPAADGLDRIRFRICARRPVPTGWNMAELAGPAVPGNPVLRKLLPVSIAAQAAFHAVVQRLRPGPDGIGWYRWLRPAAALATTLVVLTGSWAITALPQVIAPSANNGSAPGSGGGRVPVTSSSGPAAPRTGSQGPVASPSYPTSSATYPTGHRGQFPPSASPPSASPTPSSLPSASPTPSSSPSASPTPSSSPSASPTPSASCSPSASPAPSASNSHGNGRHCHHRRHH
jgi:hypothetical protein